MTVAKKSDAGVEKKVSPADRIIEKIKRHRLVTLAIVIGTITIAVGSFFGAVNKVAEFIDRFVDPKHMTVKALQDTVRTTALELKESFNTVTSGRTPPIPDGDFDRVNRLIKKIERLDPGNGHVIYYRGFITRWQNQRQASHTALFWYLERAKDPNLHMPGDNGDAKFCFDNWLGYCRQRQAFINHVLALDFERAAKEEKNHAVALARLKAALDRAETAIKLYGEFNAPGQGTPTRTLAESLRRRISEGEKLLSTPTRN
jgi:hypothetical protein